VIISIIFRNIQVSHAVVDVIHLNQLVAVQANKFGEKLHANASVQSTWLSLQQAVQTENSGMTRK
jgi:hypothetical protein